MARVLIAEDEAELAATLADVLRGAGHDVCTCSNGEDALATARDFQPDLLISDWMLGSWVDGVALIERVRGDAPGLSVILMTGYASARLRTWAQTGVDGLLEKPFSLSEFRALVERVLPVKEPA